MFIDVGKSTEEYIQLSKKKKTSIKNSRQCDFSMTIFSSFFFIFKLWKYDNTFTRDLVKYSTSLHRILLYITIIFR